MAGVRVKEKVPEVAGVKLLATGSVKRDRRVMGNLHR
jgi:hypothetical protein